MSKRHEIIDVDALPSTPERRKSSGIPMTIDLTQPKPKLNYKTLIILDDDESDEGGVVFVSSHSSRPGTTSSAIEKQGKVGKLHSNAGRIGQNSSGGDAGVAVTNLAREMHWQTQMSARASEQPHPQQIKGARISGNGGLDYPSAIGPAVEDYKNRKRAHANAIASSSQSGPSRSASEIRRGPPAKRLKLSSTPTDSFRSRPLPGKQFKPEPNVYVDVDRPSRSKSRSSADTRSTPTPANDKVPPKSTPLTAPANGDGLIHQANLSTALLRPSPSPDIASTAYRPKASTSANATATDSHPYSPSLSPTKSSSLPKKPAPAHLKWQQQQQSKRSVECIELNSDGEANSEPLFARKKQKCTIEGPGLATVEDRDSESSDYDCIHDGYDLGDTERWIPVPTKLNRLEDDLERLALTQTPPKARPRSASPEDYPGYRHPDVSDYYPPDLTISGVYIWDQLRMCENLRIRPRPKSIFKQPLLKPIKRPWDLDFNLHRLRSVHSFKESPGSINKVEQKGEWTIIASACSGGLPDFEGEEPNPHSRPGSLITYCNSTWDIPKGHQVKKGNRIKHYTVNDVKFAPTSLTFVSSGADGYVRLWTLPDESENEDSDIDSSPSSHLGNTRQWSNIYIAKLNATPHDLLFKPETSILAVATKRIQLYDLSDDDHRNVVNFKISNQLTNPNVIGAIVWGTESTKDHLFASSEPCSPEVFEGIHKVFDLESQTMIYQLDAAEAGDVIALDPTGSTLALATRGPDNKHFLRLFDARRRLPTATTHISLESFPVREENFEGEVNNATYSPDGIFLALARNDNHTHVYDVRMLGRSEGPLFDYRHSGESKVASREEMYGVVKAQWVHSEMTRRAALITAGEDGCVRMWNPLIAATNRKNGSILAEVNSDVGYFSLGDPYAGEHQLVVGDCAGEVTVFNNAVI